MRSACLLMFAAAAFASSPLRDRIASGRLDDLRWPDFSDFQGEIAAFYDRNQYLPVWSHDAAVTPQALAIIAVLQDAASKGLNPEDYDASRWAGRLARLDSVGFDLALTVCVMRYASDLHVGRWNPGIYHSSFDLHQEHLELADLIRTRVIHATDVRKALAEIEPPSAGYRRIGDALQRYLVLSRQDSGEPLPSVTKFPIEPGASYAGIDRLAMLLKTLGDLRADAAVPAKYGGGLVEAVKHFQARHGLLPDGRIGKATLEALNTPLARRVHQLELALERWRWVPHAFQAPRIVVNLPEFELHALGADQSTELEMKVVVGQTYHRKTPVFTAEMKFVIFRPYWNVPRSIARNELIPKIARDRDYLAANAYEVVTSKDKVVTSGKIDDDVLAQLRSGKLSIRQTPGPKNSLGLVKFMFPNEHNVYLHGTPARQLFARSRRDFSHGCIRVEQPEQLARWVLRDLPEWTEQRIGEAMHGERPLEVNLPKSIPVLIVYATAAVEDHGEVRFFDDIYGFDAQLDALMAQGYPCCRWDPTSGEHAPRRRE